MSNGRRKFEADALVRLFRRMGPLLKPHRGKLALGFLAMIGVAIAEVARPWPLKIVFDGILMPQANPDIVTATLSATFGTGDGLIAASALAILAIAVVGGATGFAQAYLVAFVGQKVVAQIRLDLYRHIQRLSHSFHDTASSGDIIARLTGDVRMMRDLLIDAVVFFAARALVIGTTIGIMAWMDWRLTLMALVILPPLWFITRYFGSRIKGAARRQRSKEGKIAVVMTEGISAINVVKGFAREAFEEQRFAKQNNSSAEAGVLTTRLAANMDRITQVLLALGTSLVLWYGVTRVRGGAISPGDLLVFTAYLSSLYKPVRKMSSMTSRVAKATASGERLLEIFDLEPDVAERPDAISAGRLRGEITFKNVSFSYGKSAPVLDGASLQIEPGETVAIVGPSGIGKSSATKLVMRFYDPSSGSICIDGQDVRDFTLDSLRNNISVVLQDSVLFGTTIRENIAYGRLDATDEEIVAAARAAEADKFIRDLPDGYETVLGERGETLSGGQRQRIAIARAILRDAPILILDEPLTGLDPATAQSLLIGLRRAAEGRTAVLVAHDELSLQLSTRVIRLSEGRFVGTGSKPNVEEAGSPPDPFHREGILQDGAIRGRLFESVCDGGLAGITGLEVELRDRNGALVATTLTGPGGCYEFTDLTAGDYLVRYPNEAAGKQITEAEIGIDDLSDERITPDAVRGSATSTEVKPIRDPGSGTTGHKAKTETVQRGPDGRSVSV